MGLNLSLPSHIYQQCKLTVRNILRNSSDQNIRKLYVETHMKNVNTDLLVENGQKKAEGDKLKQKSVCKNMLKTQIEEEGWHLFNGLHKQNLIIKFLLYNVFLLNKFNLHSHKLTNKVINKQAS